MKVMIDRYVQYQTSTVQVSMEGQRQFSYVQYQTIYCSGFYGRIEIVQLCSVSNNLLLRFLWEDRDSIVMFSIRQSTVQVSMKGLNIVMFSIRQSTVKVSIEGRRQFSYVQYQTIYCSGFYGRIEYSYVQYQTIYCSGFYGRKEMEKIVGRFSLLEDIMTSCSKNTVLLTYQGI